MVAKLAKRLGSGLVAGMLILAMVLPLPAEACVGKTLVVGSKGTLQQEILAEMLSVLIGERTGTTVKVVRLDSTAAAHEALMKADLDMYVEYTGVGQVEILKKAPLEDSEALYQAVKETYNQDLNLVWLKPLGFEGQEAAAGGQAAPVVRKDTLKKFPALARLINKLGGAISPQAMQDLEAQAAQITAKEVARNFLKEGKFI
ncbi:lipoprotein [Desulfuromonas versatilis]|uniref:Lipoprotein n=1 Tax=Desulfuromonas versatilis TaxID=2802975 RepID=A0ABM8HVB6_9BACT|nr:glycine betaine ABC transporter substrate-binding protein [Desulfuromonas versatilis]BCR05938.1 lipoprotein [Desulfuromonas versatilis]